MSPGTGEYQRGPEPGLIGPLRQGCKACSCSASSLPGSYGRKRTKYWEIARNESSGRDPSISESLVAHRLLGWKPEALKRSLTSQTSDDHFE
jgi:hypothetical protein